MASDFVCDKYFTFGKVETTLQALTGKTPSHSYGAWQTNDDKHWKECSCGLKSEENDHVYDDATDVTCNTCDHDRTLPHTHGNGVKQFGQSATCTVPGWYDYYKCSCGKFYTEADCTNEITDLEAWKTGAGKIEASHNYGTLVSAVTEKHTQTELVAGVAAHYHCSACGKYFTEGKVETTIEALTGTTPSHSYGDWKTDTDKHWKECSCGKKADEGNHVDANSNNKCDSCDKTLSGGVTPPPHTHDYGTTWKSDANNHWKECECGEKSENAAHSGGTATCQAKAKCEVCNAEYGELAACAGGTATCTEKAKCATCGNEYGELAPHNYNIANGYKGADGHANICSCGAHDTPVAHTPDRTEATETDPIKCTVCNFIIEPVKGHVHAPKSEWESDEDNHWHECTGCDRQQLEKATHTDSDTNGACDVCGYTMPVSHTHDYGTTWKTDANNHWKECECGEKSENAAHIDGNGDNKCDTCDYAMPSHDPGTTPPADNPPNDDDGGLGAGAIVGIVIGSVAVAGVGGFALFWFVIKKKTWADFLAIFKKK